MPDPSRTLSAPPSAQKALASRIQDGRVPRVLSAEEMAALERDLGERRLKRDRLRRPPAGPRPPTEGQLARIGAGADAPLERRADVMVSRLWREAPEVMERIRSATARLQVESNPLWRAPKDASSPGHPPDARKAKEPYDIKTTAMPGGQTQHRPQIYEDVFARHLSAPQREAIKLIRDAYEALDKVRITSPRAYTGMPFHGSAANDIGMSAKQRDYIELAREWFSELTGTTPVWAEKIAEFILHIPNERFGRVRSVSDLGVTVSGYAQRSDGATGAGVGDLNATLVRALEALQAVLMRRQHQRMARHPLPKYPRAKDKQAD